MAKVILAPFIQSISGKVGSLEFRTLKSGRTVVRARRENDYISERIPTEKELAQRRRFGVISSTVAIIQRNYDRIDEAARDRKKIWQKVAYHYAKYFETVTDDKQLQKILLEEYYS
ncbi:MAG: hypothetical protein II825_01850 [Paludibacteraceae bacterium]|nr:hypothetical protein [Paludibacteraceae bacterium]